jgi:hypothetical protein
VIGKPTPTTEEIAEIGLSGDRKTKDFYHRGAQRNTEERPVIEENES